MPISPITVQFGEQTSLIHQLWITTGDTRSKYLHLRSSPKHDTEYHSTFKGYHWTWSLAITIINNDNMQAARSYLLATEATFLLLLEPVNPAMYIKSIHDRSCRKLLRGVFLHGDHMLFPRLSESPASAWRPQGRRILTKTSYLLDQFGSHTDRHENILPFERQPVSLTRYLGIRHWTRWVIDTAFHCNMTLTR